MGKRTMKTMKSKDVQALKALARVNVMTKEQLMQIGLTKNRILQMWRDKYLKKLCYTDAQGKSFHIYCLAPKGENYCYKTLGVNTFYGSPGYKHDLALAREYLKLSLAERETVKVEGECREQFFEMLKDLKEQSRDQGRELLDRERDGELYEKLYEQYYETHKITTPDMMYTRDSGEEIAIEIRGDNYTDAYVDTKIAFADAMGVEIEVIRN